MWTVVKFTVERTVEVVPVIWLHDNDSACFWPPVSLTKKVAKYIRKLEKPQSNWNIYQVEKMTTKSFSNFDIANKMAFKAKYVSDLSSNEGSMNEKRIVKKPSRYIESTSESEDLSDVPNFGK